MEAERQLLLGTLRTRLQTAWAGYRRDVPFNMVDVRRGELSEEDRCSLAIQEPSECVVYIGLTGELGMNVPPGLPTGLLLRNPWLQGLVGRPQAEAEFHAWKSSPLSRQGEAFFYHRNTYSAGEEQAVPRWAAESGHQVSIYTEPAQLAAMVTTDLEAVMQRLSTEWHALQTEDDPSLGSLKAREKVDELRTEREMRVFVSSTFRDMEQERRLLAESVFPALRDRCERRHVTFTDVDLRWGVPDEYRAENKVLPVCLHEIARSTAFVGMIGERYGWVPDMATLQALPEPLGWVRELPGRSITELEMTRAALRGVDSVQETYFYIRRPFSIRNLPCEVREAYRESPTDDECMLNRKEQWQRVRERRSRLEALKRKILVSGLPVRMYRNPQELCRMVRRDLIRAIGRRFPASEEANPTHDAFDYVGFAAVRSQGYIDRPNYYAQLTAHVAGRQGMLVLVGPPGSGKSMLLASWAVRYRRRHPGVPVVMYMAGVRPQWTEVVRQIVAELHRQFGIRQPIPQQPELLAHELRTLLNTLAVRGPLILILDAVNQLQEDELAWIPQDLDPRVRLILSTTPGPTMDGLVRLGAHFLEIEPLTEEERQTVVRTYLGKFAKVLTPHEGERAIVSAPGAANPLYLRSLLDELRVHDRRETLAETLAEYLKAHGTVDLFNRVLARLERVYNDPQGNFVEDALSFLWAARRGLSESDLLGLLAQKGHVAPRALWSPMRLAMDRWLVSRSGIIGFFHQDLREAVERRYLKDEDGKARIHRQLANWFAQKHDPRRYEELPWQLTDAGEWGRLHSLLVDSRTSRVLWSHQPAEVKAWWRRLANEAGRDPVDSFNHVLSRPVRHIGSLAMVAEILADRGRLNEAQSLWAILQHRLEQVGDQRGLAGLLGAKARCLRSIGCLDAALESMRREADLLNTMGDASGRARCLREQVALLHRLGANEAAAEVLAGLKEEERLPAESTEAEVGLDVLIERQRMAQESGDLDALQRNLGQQAARFSEMGEHARVVSVLTERERICRTLHNRGALGNTLGSKASALRTLGDYDSALALLQEQADLCRDAQDHQGQVLALVDRAEIVGICQARYRQGIVDLMEARHLARRCRASGLEARVRQLLGQMLTLRSVETNRQAMEQERRTQEAYAVRMRAVFQQEPLNRRPVSDDEVSALKASLATDEWRDFVGEVRAA
ncbi:MAG TPA: DUF4062 domain-containing protein, partial [Symbiobacteriaceae bacterium]|nr:DUF4062 domain-containing protein [Symbiobacteriaceae bacterium]